MSERDRLEHENRVRVVIGVVSAAIVFAEQLEWPEVADLLAQTRQAILPRERETAESGR